MNKKKEKRTKVEYLPEGFIVAEVISVEPDEKEPEKQSKWKIVRIWVNTKRWIINFVTAIQKFFTIPDDDAIKWVKFTMYFAIAMGFAINLGAPHSVALSSVWTGDYSPVISRVIWNLITLFAFRGLFYYFTLPLRKKRPLGTPQENILSSDFVTYLDASGPSGFLSLPGYLGGEYLIIKFLSPPGILAELFLIWMAGMIWSLGMLYIAGPLLLKIKKFGYVAVKKHRIKEKYRGTVMISNKAIHILTKPGIFWDIAWFGLFQYGEEKPIYPDQIDEKLDKAITLSRVDIYPNGVEDPHPGGITIEGQHVKVTADIMYDERYIVDGLNVGNPDDKESEDTQKIREFLWHLCSQAAYDKIAYSQTYGEDGAPKDLDIKPECISFAFSALDHPGTDKKTGFYTLKDTAASIDMSKIVVDFSESPVVRKLVTQQDELRNSKVSTVLFNEEIQKGVNLVEKSKGMPELERLITANVATAGKIPVSDNLILMDRLGTMLKDLSTHLIPFLMRNNSDNTNKLD